ncbi:MAG: lysophospholipid acyltransferase family protein [Deltaproteobacteria bacterium]|nr:lysophospholipid acyltransferase family protein [Deltaproteobacteria bacterium]
MTEAINILEHPLSNLYRPENRILKLFSDAALTTLDSLMALPAIREYYHNMPESNDPFSFIENALETLGIKYDTLTRKIKIPERGPLIVVSNHPFGGIDGLVLASIISKARKDVRILANHYLGLFKELEPILFPVDPFLNRRSIGKNTRAILKAASWVKNGGLLITFPAGEVSHFSIKKRNIADPPWHNTISRIVHLTESAVLPVYFYGDNSPLFHFAGIVHPRFRTALLPRELLKKRCSEIGYKIGHTIPYKRLADITDTGALTSYLRFRTELLSRSVEHNDKILPFKKKSENISSGKIIIEPVKSDILAGELLQLPDDQKLISTDDFSVYCAEYLQVPHVLREIGRLREITFRSTGEGTGNSIDLDRFDQTYTHIILWNEKNQEIAGAYRLGRTDEILAREGKKGLYTSTLFKYRNSFLNNYSPALEMGRTFIREEYQRSYSALLLLWKGIGQYVVNHMKYRYLFGAVSISKEYKSYSRKLMVSFLEMNHGIPHLSRLIKPRTPFRIISSRPGINRALHWGDDIEEVSSWISGIEKDDKGVPVLLRQYLKLGGRIISFNVDERFSDVLDGLILVDLMESDEKLLSRYMGEQGLKQFREYHSEKNIIHPHLSDSRAA